MPLVRSNGYVRNPSLTAESAYAKDNKLYSMKMKQMLKRQNDSSSQADISPRARSRYMAEPAGTSNRVLSLVPTSPILKGKHLPKNKTLRRNDIRKSDVSPAGGRLDNAYDDISDAEL